MAKVKIKVKILRYNPAADSKPYWKTYEPEVEDDSTILDILNTIQFHDENYNLWLEYIQTGNYDRERFQVLLNTVENWDLFLMFIIVDGCTEGKELAKLYWFIDEVRKYKTTKIDTSWILDL